MTGIWAVRDEADREQWTYSPSVRVGPLRFGMDPAEAAAAMTGFAGRTTAAYHDQAQRSTVFWRESGAGHLIAVTAYFSADEGLHCVAVDARLGPQVTMDGIRLVGRVPSQLEAELFGYLTARGVAPRYAPEGDLGPEEFGLIMRVQRAGDVVLTRPVFAVVRAIANTMWDSMPADEFEVH